jgi:hypothetical protein
MFIVFSEREIYIQYIYFIFTYVYIYVYLKCVHPDIKCRMLTVPTWLLSGSLISEHWPRRKDIQLRVQRREIKKEHQNYQLFKMQWEVVNKIKTIVMLLTLIYCFASSGLVARNGVGLSHASSRIAGCLPPFFDRRGSNWRGSSQS